MPWRQTRRRWPQARRRAAGTCLPSTLLPGWPSVTLYGTTGCRASTAPKNASSRDRPEAVRSSARRSRRNSGASAQEGGDHVFVLLGLARTGAIDQPAARSHERRRAIEQVELGGRQARRSPRAGGPSGCRDRAARSQGPSTARRPARDRRHPPRREVVRRRHLHDREHRHGPSARASRAARRTRRGRTSQATTMAAGAAPRGQRHGLAAWRGAQVQHAMSRRDCAKLRDELRGFVLHDEAPLAKRVRCQRGAVNDEQPVPARRRGFGRHALAEQSRCQFVARAHAERLAARHSAGASLLKASQRSVSVAAVAREPALHQPLRMGMRTARCQRPSGASGHDSCSRSRDERAKHGIDKRRPRSSCRARLDERHRVVDHGGGRNAIEIEQLKRAEAQRRQHRGVQSVERPRAARAS